MAESTTVEELAERFGPQKAKPTATEAYVENLANPSVKCLLLASLFGKLQRTLVVVCADPAQVGKYAAELNQLLPDLPGSPAIPQVLTYPTETYSPYDQSTLPVHALRDHYQVLARLTDTSAPPAIVLLSPKSLLLKHLTYETVLAKSLTLTDGEDIPVDSLCEQLLALGYMKNSLILEPGEFSRRGDIVDIYPVNGEPVRCSFFGDTVENIRVIDIERQRSVAAVKTTTVLPRHALTLDAASRPKLIEAIHAAFDKQQGNLDDTAREALHTSLTGLTTLLEQDVANIVIPDGLDFYAPLLHDGFASIIEMLPSDAICVLDDWNVLTNNLAGLSDRLTREHDEGIAKGRILDVGQVMHLTDAEGLSSLKAQIPQRLLLDTLPINAQGQFPIDTLKDLFPLTLHGVPRFKANLLEAVDDFGKRRREGIQVLISTRHPQRIMDACKEGDIPATYWATPEDGEASSSQDNADKLAMALAQKDVVIAKNGPHEGFVLPDEHLAYFTDAELFGRSQKRVLINKKSRKHRDDIDVLNSVNDLKPGDYVVHVKHGIGQFKEVTQISVDNETREYLTISYLGTDRLHVPVDQVNLLSRYRGAGDKAPKLNKMGGTDWNRVKGKAKKAIASIARDLIELYARRARAKGHVFDGDSPWQVEMEEAFPYTETPDQFQAIQDMKGDMESERVMDRLICGDVGFGKTEVALRGIFKACLTGKQAAVLCPTTILAQQHFNTLTERFKPYPVRIGLLSRFRTAKEQKEVVKKLAAGEVDVVVGTHRLLQKDIKFSDLGLLVIDEEQRFGVSHKEKIKTLRANLDVMTLSATPIPRTLYMSLSGVREMSLIKTPPTNRLPIQTYVGPYNPAQIRMAILQELDRGGQVYFLHNRVQTIYQMEQHLKDLIPEARFRVGHGQMSGDELETVMLDFAEHQFDVLVCTTIIESGVDIPNVNTMIVDQANKFGLAQLYQIRGRVGRSDKQAYCYCYYEPERILTSDAQDRLRALREFTTLGSGYQIAMRDMEIRGVGNILGADQHGHMISVGFDLYCQMLEEAIAELKGEKESSSEPAIIDLNVTAMIPEEYVGDLDVKLSEYKRLADVRTEMQLEHIQAEWRDRFGEIPEETLQLVRLVKLRLLATELRIAVVRADDDSIRISVPLTLQEWMFLQSRIDPKLSKKARWVPAVKSKQGALPVLLVKHRLMDGNDQVDYLMALFTDMKRVKDDVLAEAAAKQTGS